jgi:transcriptional regulator of arginine metabolism
MKKRMERQQVIANIVRRDRIRTQRELVERLREFGHECTQATVSRDVTVMGLRKQLDGVYVLAEDLHLHRMISELVLGVVRSDKLVLVKASPGTAAGVAAALDAAGLDEVLGSIAGDDTVLVISRTEDDAASLVDSIEKYRGTSS